MVCTFSNLLLQVWNSAKCEIHFDIHGVFRKNCVFFPIHCNPSYIAYIAVSSPSKLPAPCECTVTLLLAGNFLYVQPLAAWVPAQYLINTLYYFSLWGWCLDIRFGLSILNPPHFSTAIYQKKTSAPKGAWKCNSPTSHRYIYTGCPLFLTNFWFIATGCPKHNNCPISRLVNWSS